MKILCVVNQAECFRNGIDAPASTAKLDVNPAKLPQDLREFVADHLYEGHKLGGRWYYDPDTGKGEDVTDEQFELWSPDLTGFMEAILRAQAFEKANTESDSHVSFEDWKKVQGTAAGRTKKAKELAEAQKENTAEARNLSPSSQFDPERFKKDMEGTIQLFSESSKAEASKRDKEDRERKYVERMNQEKTLADQQRLIEKQFGSKK